jgi:methylase of polypeptide subunit release factors
MPRLPPALFRQAAQISPHLPTLLPVCRDIPSAANELRWIKQHIAETRGSSFGIPDDKRLLRLCQQRGRGVPLQYVLGSQPFGPLDIKCRPGVLIPR